MVSERWLPDGCQPRWLKLDRRSLGTSGGVAIYLRKVPRVETVAERVGNHPWRAEMPVYARKPKPVIGRRDEKEDRFFHAKAPRRKDD